MAEVSVLLSVRDGSRRQSNRDLVESQSSSPTPFLPHAFFLFFQTIYLMLIQALPVGCLGCLACVSQGKERERREVARATASRRVKSPHSGWPSRKRARDGDKY